MRILTKKSARWKEKAKEVASLLEKEAPRIDDECIIPPRALELLWEAGFMTMASPPPPESRPRLTEMCLVAEELAKGDPSVALLVGLQALSLFAVNAAAEKEEARKFLEQVAQERKLLAFALTEPEPSSESDRITTASRTKGGYIIRGRKSLVSGAREADLVLVFAVTAKKAGLKKAISLFAVPAGTPGMLPGPESVKTGLRGVPAVDLYFEGCRVPASARIGKPGTGYRAAREATIISLPLVASIACGMLSQALDHTLSRLKEKQAGSSPLSESQPLKISVADLKLSLDTALALTWAAAGALEEGLPLAEILARECKWLATENAIKGIDLATGILGPEALVKGALLERLSRDARALKGVLGPNHLHRVEAARKILAQKKK